MLYIIIQLAYLYVSLFGGKYWESYVWRKEEASTFQQHTTAAVQRLQGT
jgi:hypothetical protein